MTGREAWPRLAVALILAFAACGKPADAPSPGLPADFTAGRPYFVRKPFPTDWRQLRKAPGSFAKARKWGPLYDLRQADLSALDLSGRAAELGMSFFDTVTKWPAALPEGFDPVQVLASNRDPGLGLRGLQARGLSGRGVAVAIIDTPLLLEHAEYAGRILFYGEVNAWGPANFHGTLVASILAGRTCGVAPEAEIYYVGSHNYDADRAKGTMTPNVGHYAKALDLLLELNRRLPEDRRIRVVSISAGWGPKDPGGRAMDRAVRRAAAAGIFVVSANIFDSFSPGFWFWGFDRAGREDPNDLASARILGREEWVSQVAGRDGFDGFYKKRLDRAGPIELLLVPEGSKTVAQAGGPDEYGFYRMGGWSSVCPFIAGLYALACQVKPDVTPEIFWRAALATGDPAPVPAGKSTYPGRYVNPSRLIESLR